MNKYKYKYKKIMPVCKVILIMNNHASLYSYSDERFMAVPPRNFSKGWQIFTFNVPKNYFRKASITG